MDDDDFEFKSDIRSRGRIESARQGTLIGSMDLESLPKPSEELEGITVLCDGEFITCKDREWIPTRIYGLYHNTPDRLMKSDPVGRLAASDIELAKVEALLNDTGSVIVRPGPWNLWANLGEDFLTTGPAKGYSPISSSEYNAGGLVGRYAEGWVETEYPEVTRTVIQDAGRLVADAMYSSVRIIGRPTMRFGFSAHLESATQGRQRVTNTGELFGMISGEVDVDNGVPNVTIKEGDWSVAAEMDYGPIILDYAIYIEPYDSE